MVPMPRPLPSSRRAGARLLLGRFRSAEGRSKSSQHKRRIHLNGANDEDHADGGISDGKVRSDKNNNNDDDESNDDDDDDPWRLTGMNDDIGRDKAAPSSEDDDDWRPMRVAVKRCARARSLLALLVQFVGLMPRRQDRAVGSGEYGRR